MTDVAPESAPITFLEVFASCADGTEKIDLLAQAVNGLVTGEHAAELKASLDAARNPAPIPDPVTVDMTTIGAGDDVQAPAVEDQLTDPTVPISAEADPERFSQAAVQGDVDEAQSDLEAGRLGEVGDDLAKADADLAG